ncbi:GMC oxidoreductase [Phenylobacterium deserti]|uniref:GMC family oxidoreductase n=1 Tax=Phenylobacterium deserti TaxID=1914756 RepID=A0A328A898_9CAUL|nr:GMC family oxidoreductase [Phenylobacterium deserti]RAK50750.1 GMC family oxidoreductase [Phenylobacterium deserti]
MSFDAIVVGSGMSGGWAAKELAEKGLKTLVIERGRPLQHQADYTDFVQPWELQNYGMVSEAESHADYPVQSQCYAFTTATKHLWVKDSDHPYTTPPDKPFMWIRGYHLGGRSIMWARQSYRLSPMDFESNKKDGYGSDWPIRYEDMAPWYDHVERFAGISGAKDGLEQLPDGDEYLPPMELTGVEKEFKSKLEARWPTRRLITGRCAHLTEAKPHHQELGRGQCQYRSLCDRGCSYGAYFSSLSATLPAAERTGNLTVVTNAIAHSVIYDPKTGKASGVRVIDAVTKQGRVYEGKVIFLCASAIGTAQIMLNSKSEAFPNGIANRSDAVGRYLMDHLSGLGGWGRVPGHHDRYHRGRRPNGFYIPRYRNVTEPGDGYTRGFGFQGRGQRANWRRGMNSPGVGAEFKQSLRSPGDWELSISGFGEMLPRPENRVTLHKNKVDQWGIPVVHIDCGLGPNEQKMIEQIGTDARAILEAAGCEDVQVFKHYGGVGLGIHELGTAHMGRDPNTSVLNKYNQAHDVPNLFVTDGACMASGGCQNPSLSYMAMSARGAHYAASFLKEGKI